MRKQSIKRMCVAYYMLCYVRDNEQNVTTLYMDTVKYATPVEMQNPLKS
jgi:hypothetical protein